MRKGAARACDPESDYGTARSGGPTNAGVIFSLEAGLPRAAITCWAPRLSLTAYALTVTTPGGTVTMKQSFTVD
jgi:hypothetical protein